MLSILHSNKPTMNLEIEDEKFDKLTGLFEGIKKIFSIHVKTLSDIEAKVN